MDFNPRHAISGFLIFSSSYGICADAPCPQGLAAFEKNLYTPILRHNCVECHDVGGIGPEHSTADPIASYAAIETYVNFAQMDQSRIIQHVQTKHWVNYDTAATGVSVDQMTGALQAWWADGEKSCPNSSTAQTSAAAIPAGLPVFPAESFVKMSWALDALDPEFKGSQFEVEIQQLAAPTSTTSGAYRLRKPRLSTPQSGISFEGIRFYINGKLLDSANGWAHLGARIAGHGNTFDQAPVLSGRHLILLQDLAVGDVLSVAFTGVQVIAAPKCGNLAVFQAKILPVIQKNSCISCHAAGPPSDFDGSRYLSFQASDDQVCASVLERTSLVHQNASPFYLIGFLQSYDHPPTLPAPASFSQDWQSWVTGEQTQTPAKKRVNP